MLMRQWSPISPVPGTSSDNNTPPSKQRTFLRWCKLIISALIPIILASFFIVYLLQKENLFEEKYQREQTNQLNQQQKISFDTYINEISTILLEVSNKNNISENVRLHIQTKTLIILRNLDIKRKKDVILFLYERNLIQNNQLNLYGADFNNVELTCPHDFHHLHLSGVIWSNAVFINCRLTGAVFNQAYLFNARFINSTLQYASLIETNLDRSEFIETIILNTNFNGASLLQANFLRAEIVQGNNFTNADLFQAHLTDGQLQGHRISIIKHDFYHARFPNGSFGSLNSEENLVSNGDAEMCLSDTQTAWVTVEQNMSFVAEPNENTTIDDHDWGKCLFVISAKTQVYQNISLHSYPLLIDTNNAAFSFSAFASCYQSYFKIDMYRPDSILHGSQTYSEPLGTWNSYNNISMYKYGGLEYHISKRIRTVRIYLGVEPLKDDIKCYFDNITFQIFQRQTN